MTSSLLLLVFVLLVAALAAGLALGWFLGTRGLQPLRLEIEAARRETEAARSEGENWRSKFSEAIVNLAAERKTAERAEALESELRQERVASASLSSRIAAFERGEEERQRAHDSQLAQLKDLETKLEARFGELAGRAIEGAHDLFLKRADARFNQAGEKHEEKLKALLQPVETTLKRYEEGLSRVEKERVGSYGELKAAVELVRAGQSQVRDETARLVNALRHSPKSRGRWGEQSLRNVLEQAGLSPYADFKSEVSVDTGDGRLRPDVVVSLPGGRKLIIDAKCSLNAFLDASEEVVGAKATVHGIPTASTEQTVVAERAEEDVVACSATYEVIPGATPDAV